MPRPEKVQAVTEIKERLEKARAVFLAEYAGLSVQDQQELRRSLRNGGAEFKVMKMTLARRAAADLDIDSLDALLLGPTGLAFADEDAVVAAKVLRDFAKDHEVFKIKGGLLGRDFLTPERIDDLAAIESRDVLLARILGAARAPLAKMAGLMAALPRGLATAMQQLIDKMPEEPVAAASEAVATEGPAGDGEPAAESAPPEEEREEPAAEPTASGDIAEPEGEAEEDRDDAAAESPAPTDSGDAEEAAEADNDDEPAEAAEEE